MRELSRCVVWAFCLGALALIVATVIDIGLAQTDGAAAWIVLAVYAPFYLLGHAMADGTAPVHEPAFLAATFAMQFCYFLAVVATTRLVLRARSRRRR